MARFSLNQQVRLQHKLKVVAAGTVVAAAIAGICIFIYLNMGRSREAMAATELLPTGSYIINMGVSPQTPSNALRPYGMVYEMITTHRIPVKWVINTGKVKDGTDFTHNGVNYRGGPFIIPGNLITPAIQSRIAFWNGLGVQGAYTTSAVSVPVHLTLNAFPRVVIDTLSGNQNIVKAYFDSAYIPAATYRFATPSSVSGCDDLWVNPHGDPAWSTHGNLLNFAMNHRGYIWSQCHAVSMMENVTNASNSTQKLNFLSTTGLQCYKSGKCTGVSEVHARSASTPFSNNLVADPAMQFIGGMNGATADGSEQWFVPLNAGSWRSTTRRLVTTGTGASPREGVVLVYGPAFGNTNNGWVMYEGGHDLNGTGAIAEKVAAQRAFLNFCLLAGIGRTAQVTSSSIQSSFVAGMNAWLSASVSGGTPPYTLQWTSTVAGTFSDPQSASTMFTPALTGSNHIGSITLLITDACGRISYETRPISVSGSSLPVTLISMWARSAREGVVLEWRTAEERNSDYFTLFRAGEDGAFREVARIRASGESQKPRTYGFVDKSAPAGKLLYRLSQTDRDGSNQVFDPVSVVVAGRVEELRMIPNPVNESSGLSFYYDQTGQALIELTAVDGRKIKSKTIQLVPGMNRIPLSDFGKLETGTFLAHLLINGQPAGTVRFTKAV